jgi:hypothetical protein
VSSGLTTQSLMLCLRVRLLTSSPIRYLSFVLTCCPALPGIIHIIDRFISLPLFPTIELKLASQLAHTTAHNAAHVSTDAVHPIIRLA